MVLALILVTVDRADQWYVDTQFLEDLYRREIVDVYDVRVFDIDNVLQVPDGAPVGVAPAVAVIGMPIRGRNDA